MKDLRGGNIEARQRAAILIGADEASYGAKEAPDEVLLRYASLGTGSDEQAIVAAEYGLAMLIGAVGVRRNNNWERIATFSCWCKYERGDLLGNFIRIEIAPDGRSELVVHTSGGGTGLYEQDESHFRYYRGELRRVLNFVSHLRDCNSAAPEPSGCRVERRWFFQALEEATPEGYLVEARFSLPASSDTDAELEVDNLDLKHVKTLSCRRYVWSSREFLYKATGTFLPCQPPRPVE